MADPSVYESNNPAREKFRNRIVFGRITQVFPEERLVEVKTFGNDNDEHIPKCQWLNMDASPDGDESTAIPRRNSYCLVVYVDGEPFVLGFFTPLDGSGTAQVGQDKDPLNEGDRIISTVGKNFIIWRSGGEIQIQSSNTCQTIMVPDKDLIRTICRNYEFRTDGGTVDWVKLNENDTLCTTEFRDNIQRDNIIVEEKGQVGGEVLWRLRMGPPIDGSPFPDAIWEQSILKDGTTETIIAKKTTVRVDASGQVNVDVNGATTITITPDGKVTIKNDGDYTVESKGKGTLIADKYDIDGASGSGVLEPVHTFPSAISDFTGLPIQKASDTVKATK